MKSAIQSGFLNTNKVSSVLFIAAGEMKVVDHHKENKILSRWLFFFLGCGNILSDVGVKTKRDQNLISRNYYYHRDLIEILFFFYVDISPISINIIGDKRAN